MKLRRRIFLTFANYAGNPASILLFFVIPLGFSLSILPLEAQDGRRTLNTTVCDIASHQERFDGKIVRVRAQINSGIEVFGLSDPDRKCKNIFWLTYPDLAHTSQPQVGSAIKHIPVELRKDQQFVLFEKYLDAEIYPRFLETHCIHCMRYEVTATLTGRVDVATKEQRGFGHLNGWKIQLVLQTVADIKAKDISPNYDPREYSTEPVQLRPKQWRKPTP
jgi:hypothetical protein